MTNRTNNFGKGLGMACVATIGLALASTARADDIQDLKNQVAQLTTLINQQDSQIQNLEKALAISLQKTQYVTVGGKSMYIRGCNLWIQNSANGYQTPNGLGNLILGFNPMRGGGKDVRTGSHFLVMGDNNNYQGNSGIVGGSFNDCSANSAILTGNHNVADGMESVILTGGLNEAHATYSLIGGGLRNYVRDIAEGGTILGGSDNGSHAFFATVLGGKKNGAESKYASVMTGYNNIAYNDYGAVITGDSNYSAGDNTNLILTGKNNSFKISPVGCVWLTGNGCGADWDNSDPNNWKPWTYRAMTEGWLVIH